MSLRNLLKKDVISCTPDTTVKAVAELMDDKDVGAVMIVDSSKKPVGIITDRDIVIRCIAGGKNCDNVKVKDIMTDGVESVSIDDGIFDVVKAMKEGEIRRVPVVDEAGKAVGLVSFGDIMALLGKEISDLSVPATPDKPKLKDQAA